MTDHVDIDALVERAIRRDAEAFRALYEEFAPRITFSKESRRSLPFFFSGLWRPVHFWSKIGATRAS